MKEKYIRNLDEMNFNIKILNIKEMIFIQLFLNNFFILPCLLTFSIVYLTRNKKEKKNVVQISFQNGYIKYNFSRQYSLM